MVFGYHDFTLKVLLIFEKSLSQAYVESFVSEGGGKDVKAIFKEGFSDSLPVEKVDFLLLMGVTPEKIPRSLI